MRGRGVVCAGGAERTRFGKESKPRGGMSYVMTGAGLPQMDMLSELGMRSLEARAKAKTGQAAI